MKDMMMEIYDFLCADPTIAEHIDKTRIKFYELPETFDASKPFIILDVLDPISDSTFGSNKPLNQGFSYQINVETDNRVLTKEISKAVKDAMWEHGFRQLNGGLDEYFKETKRFVDARRYRTRTKLYDHNY